MLKNPLNMKNKYMPIPKFATTNTRNMPSFIFSH